jgi:hypothetical protein
MLIGKNLDKTQGVISVITSFKESFPISCKGLDEKLRAAFEEKMDKIL